MYAVLYSWDKYLQREKHTQQPFESLLLNVFNNYFNAKDQFDTNLNQRNIKGLALNPSYLSHEFSTYCEDLFFDEFIGKQRIEKAKELMRTASYSLTAIAYLTGFSDQSHFTRIFKKHTGENPSAYRKKLKEK